MSLVPLVEDNRDSNLVRLVDVDFFNKPLGHVQINYKSIKSFNYHSRILLNNLHIYFSILNQNSIYCVNTSRDFTYWVSQRKLMGLSKDFPGFGVIMSNNETEYMVLIGGGQPYALCNWQKSNDNFVSNFIQARTLNKIVFNNLERFLNIKIPGKNDDQIDFEDKDIHLSSEYINSFSDVEQNIIDF